MTAAACVIGLRFLVSYRLLASWTFRANARASSVGIAAKSTGSPQDDDMSPAEYAAQNGHGACLQLLLGAGAKPPREWGVEEGESCVFQIGQGFSMVFKTSCSTSE